MKTALLGLFACSLLLAGCGSLLPKPAPLPALHDFGVSPAKPAAESPGALRITSDVTAPVWLEGTEIYYRLAYVDATRLRAYADNRWIAPPADLLQARLAAMFGNVAASATPAAHAYRLHVRLLDFEQVFAGPRTASTYLRALAELQDSSTGATVAQRVFSITQSAAPNVNGAVQGASQVADALVAALAQWVQASTASGQTVGADGSGPG